MATKKRQTKGPAKPRGRGAIPTDTTYEGAPFNDQDVKHRLGNFSTAGEHSLVGGRTAGIVGQTKQKNKTDKKSPKK
jgi:hypothetical protein